MVDNRSIAGATATIFLTYINEVTEHQITFLLAVLVASSTVVYNVMKICNEVKNRK